MSTEVNASSLSSLPSPSPFVSASSPESPDSSPSIKSSEKKERKKEACYNDIENGIHLNLLSPSSIHGLTRVYGWGNSYSAIN